jgi:Cu/Ag efflux pump CusA
MTSESRRVEPASQGPGGAPPRCIEAGSRSARARCHDHRRAKARTADPLRLDRGGGRLRHHAGRGASYLGLLAGLSFAIILVYLLIVVNFQSWLDPFIIITALPAALAGIVVFLFITRTTLSVPALMGAIMCMGVATANSILVVAFAKERLTGHGDAALAGLEAGFTRFRPVLMTALAMIIGMIPMALGLGEGGEQNAPLGRAVIGGLVWATVATLTFVPVVFSWVHARPGGRESPPSGANDRLPTER